MNHTDLRKDLLTTERMAIAAMPYIPKRSKYRSWAYQLLAEEIAAWKYAKLRARLLRFHGAAPA